jgi:hypothetical protein
MSVSVDMSSEETSALVSTTQNTTIHGAASSYNYLWHCWCVPMNRNRVAYPEPLKLFGLHYGSTFFWLMYFHDCVALFAYPAFSVVLTMAAADPKKIKVFTKGDVGLLITFYILLALWIHVLIIMVLNARRFKPYRAKAECFQFKCEVPYDMIPSSWGDRFNHFFHFTSSRKEALDFLAVKDREAILLSMKSQSSVSFHFHIYNANWMFRHYIRAYSWLIYMIVFSFYNALLATVFLLRREL